MSVAAEDPREIWHCEQCGSAVHAQRVTGSSVNALIWVIPVDDRGWCPDCCWMERPTPHSGDDLACS